MIKPVTIVVEDATRQKLLERKLHLRLKSVDEVIVDLLNGEA